MRPDARTFALLGPAGAVAAVILAPIATGSIAEVKTGLTAAALLVVLESGAALYAAGAQERARRPLAWIRVGLLTAVLSFLAIVALAAPSVLFAVLAGAGGVLALTLGVIVLAFAAGCWLIVRIHHIVWRRFAPKTDA